MGEAPPYSQGQLHDLLKGAKLTEVVSYTESTVVFELWKDEKRIELEIDAQPDWPTSQFIGDMVETAAVEANITVYVRGIELEDVR